MKIKLIILALVFSIAHVNANDSYDIHQYMNVAVGKTTNTLFDEDAETFRISARVQKNRNLGFEYGFSYYNDLNSYFHIDEHPSAMGLFASVVGRVQISKSVDAFAKVGVLSWGLLEWDDSGIDLTYGAGIGFKVSNTTKVVLEYNRETVFDYDFDTYTVGISFTR